MASMAACGGGGKTTQTTPGTGGTPAGSITFSATTLDFGSVPTGTPKALGLTITNSGSSSVTITQITASDAQFSLSGIVLPLTLNSKQSASGVITFIPNTAGPTTASISVSGSSGTLGSLPLKGSGLSALAHAVDVTWTISSSSSVVGYNIYRSTVSGGPYSKVGSATGPTFTDSTALPGQTYFYVVTAVDGAGSESVVSGEVTAVIPTP
ncbi:MAG TPA: choice-of-anchor D domain-containing protein [Candidatus Saccharimonadales bacterium]|nr:choice-of-anchor D domain-containing protein [Candidatus Saccharimonadales bacterium]